MNKSSAFLVFLLIGLSCTNVNSQFSKENNGEFIFSFSNVERNRLDIPTKMRFTCFFHMGQDLHYDFSSFLGFFSGYGIRNIGIVTEENNITIKRRTYSLGIPLAIKMGTLKNHVYLFGGGEYELFFHYKQKQLINDTKIKESEWFSSRTRRFEPSFFAGFQFPGGIKLKFKYYPGSFLNLNYSGKDFGVPVNYSDYNKIQLFYFSLSFNFKSKDLKKLYNSDGETGRIATL